MTQEPKLLTDAELDAAIAAAGRATTVNEMVRNFALYIRTAQAQAAAQEQRIAELEAVTKTLRGHIAHMANWITRANKGVKQGPYSFEALGEDFAALGEQQ